MSPDVPATPLALPWAEVEQQAPELAAQVRERFQARRHHVMATLRTDGSPRLSGTEVAWRDGELTLGAMTGTRRVADLRRDPRVALHSQGVDPAEGREAEWEGEAKVSGVAVPLPADADSDHLAVRVSALVLTRVRPDGQALVITSWHAGRGEQRVERV